MKPQRLSDDEVTKFLVGHRVALAALMIVALVAGVAMVSLTPGVLPRWLAVAGALVTCGMFVACAYLILGIMVYVECHPVVADMTPAQMKAATAQLLWYRDNRESQLARAWPRQRTSLVNSIAEIDAALATLQAGMAAAADNQITEDEARVALAVAGRQQGRIT